MQRRNTKRKNRTPTKPTRRGHAIIDSAGLSAWITGKLSLIGDMAGSAANVFAALWALIRVMETKTARKYQRKLMRRVRKWRK
jgi:hypothetical protein